MKNFKLTKIIASLLIVASVLALNPIGASASWKQDSKGWWYTQGSSWYTGWKLIEGNWYYFNSDGYMAKDTTIDRYCLNSSGVWINTIPAANGPVSFEEALAMVLIDTFPDNNYISIKDDNDSDMGYYSMDHSGINGNPEARNMSESRGESIHSVGENAGSVDMDYLFGGDNVKLGTKVCYDFSLCIGGQLFDGYYVEASTGKVYKWHMGHVKSLN